jgi:hypothetical protein
VRELNMATLALPGLANPGVAHAAVGALATPAGRLPQGLGQLADFLERAAEAGALCAVSGAFVGDVPAAIATSGEWRIGRPLRPDRWPGALGNAQFALSGLAAGGRE